jgi:hypothetical protein
MTKVISQDTGELTTVIDVSYVRKYETGSGIADITLVSEAEKNSLNVDEGIRIEDGNKGFIGNVAKIGDTQPYEIKVYGRFRKTFDFDINNRIFYETDSGKARRKAIQEKVEERGLEIADTGDNLNGVSSNAPVFELADFSQISPQQVGSDLLFVGFPEGNTNTSASYQVTFDNIDFQGDEFQRLKIRMIANNLGDVFDFEIEYQVAGTNYIWTRPEFDGAGTLNLNPARATSEGSQLSTNNKLQIRISLQGQLVESRAVLIDSVQINSLDVSQRNIPFDSVDIQDTGRQITRIVDKSLNEFLYTLDEADDGNTIVTTDNDIIYKSVDDQKADLRIDNDTPLIDFTVEDDTDRITNQVTIDGEGFKITVKDSASIGFYNDKVRKQRDINETITRRSDAERRAVGVLQNKAFVDRYITVITPPIEPIRNAEIGDTVRVVTDEIQGDFYILRKEKREDESYILEIEVPRTRVES